MSTVGMSDRLELSSFAGTALRAPERSCAARRMALAVGLLVLIVVLVAAVIAVSMAIWLPIVNAAHDNRKSIAATLSATIASRGIHQAAKQYHELKVSQPNLYNFDEDELNSLGYELIRADKLKQAIRIFQLNVEAYPRSSNVYDSLAEAYMDDGNKPLAIANYQQSLELNPKNRAAVRMLKKLNARGFVLWRASREPI